MLVTNSILIDSFGMILSIVITLYAYFKWKFTYWSSRNVPQLPPSTPLGNINNPVTTQKSLDLQIADIHNAHKARGDNYAGFYMFASPNFLVIDPKLLKNIMTKDFSHFVNHAIYYNEKDDPLSAHLVSLEDEKWRNLRMRLTPTFTAMKMKMMFPTVVDCGKPLFEEIARLVEAKEVLDIKDLVSRFTTDVIGSCAFGLDCNSFKDPDTEFRKHGRLVFNPDFKELVVRLCGSLFPNVLRKLRFKILHERASSFFMELIKSTVDFREKSETNRKDFLQLLIDLKKQNQLTFNELAAQAFIFFVGGFETSSTSMTFCLYELARNQDVQEKLREEINDVLNNGNITYECMNEMKYLGQVINESLRLYPPFPTINRICTKPYKIPGTNIVLEKGTNVFASNYAMQRDAEFYPNPESFDPDRFAEENKDNIVPYTFLPFGEGPRNCIGNRFALMQMKVGLITILKNFKLKLNAKTPKVLRLDPKNFIIVNLDTIYLDAEKIVA